MRADLYVDGCDVSFDPATADNVRANLVSVGGRTYLLRPGDTRSLGPAPVLDGRGCLALPGLIDAAGADRGADVRAGVTAVVGGVPGPWRYPPRPPGWDVAPRAWDDLHAALEGLVASGLTPGQAIARATLHPGAQLGGDPPLGRIAEGAAADWILVAGGPLHDLGPLRQPRHVVIGGVRVAGSG